MAGAGWSAILQFLSVPLVVNLIGVEGYGLVGFFTTLQVSLQMLDLGFSATINRELARYSSRAENSDEARDLLRTMEVVYLR
jgi:O-antigen/teichoic acid export membrane protein